MKKSRKPLQENYSTEGWMSFSDIMTGLLFIFLLIIMTMMYLNREENTRYRDLQEREAALNEKIKLMDILNLCFLKKLQSINLKNTLKP